MSLARRVLLMSGIMIVTCAQGWSQSKPERAGFWAGVELGYSSLDRFSDQEPRDRQGGLAMGFSAGGTLNRYVRLGGEIKGWLLQSGSLEDPEKGESISEVLAIMEVYPSPERSLFFKAGFGSASYHDRSQSGYDSSGWGGTLGAGYDWPLGSRFCLAPVINYSQGNLGSVDNHSVTSENRRYRVIDFGVVLSYP